MLGVLGGEELELRNAGGQVAQCDHTPYPASS